MSMWFASASASAIVIASAMVIGVITASFVARRTRRSNAWRAVRLRTRRVSGEAGMSTAEYAVGTIAACAFAAVLYQVVTGDSIVAALRDLITSALSSLS